MAGQAGARTTTTLARRAAGRLVRTVRSAAGARTSPPEPAKTVTAKKVTRPRPEPIPASEPGQPVCLACLSPRLHPEVISDPKSGRTITITVCDACRYVSLPENTHNYMAATHTDNLAGGVGARCGTVDTPGREFGMAKLGAAVLGHGGLHVLVYGAGASVDNHHIAKLPRVARVAIGDLVPLRDDAEFVDTSQMGSHQFDLVLASEVLEHFPDPRANFANLMSFVKDDGLVIASTNIRDKLPMDKVAYVWARGHVSYYSPRSLRVIARSLGVHVDFRVPLVGTGRGGPRKRYVLLSPSRQVMDDLCDYFGSHMYAPSEPLTAVPKTPSARAGA